MKKIIKKFLPLLLFLTSFPPTHAVLWRDKCLVQAGSNKLNTRYPRAITFIKKEIQAAGMMPEALQIVLGTGWHCKLDSETPWYILSIPENGGFSLKALEAALANNGDISPYQFVISHEVNHLFGNHATRRAAVQIIKDIGVTAFAVATHALIYCKSEKMSTAQYLALHATAAALEYCAFTKNPAVYAYIRSLEQEADDNVRNDVTVLKGGIKFLEAHKTSEISTGCLQYIKKLLSTHPEISTRVVKLQERIKALEQKL